MATQAEVTVGDARPDKFEDSQFERRQQLPEDSASLTLNSLECLWRLRNRAICRYFLHSRVLAKDIEAGGVKDHVLK